MQRYFFFAEHSTLSVQHYFFLTHNLSLWLSRVSLSLLPRHSTFIDFVVEDGLCRRCSIGLVSLLARLRFAVCDITLSVPIGVSEDQREVSRIVAEFRENYRIIQGELSHNSTRLEPPNFFYYSPGVSRYAYELS